MSGLASSLAIYGAVVSTTIALIQIRKYLSERNYLAVRVERSFDESGEIVEFRISNIGGKMTRIDSILITSNELSKEGKIIPVAGNGQSIFRMPTRYIENTEIELPVNLDPGDSVYVSFSGNESIGLVKNYAGIEFDFINVFTLEIEHSQSPMRHETFFEISTTEHLVKQNQLKSVGRLDLLRSRIWHLDRGEH